MGKEIKKETDWLGREKEVVYEDGNKVGEIKEEQGFFGSKSVIRDDSGSKVGEVEHKEGIFGSKDVIRDTNYNKVSETRYGQGFFGNRNDIYEDGEKIGEIGRREKTFLGDSRRRVHDRGADVDPLTRTSRSSSSSESSYDSGSDSDYSSGSGGGGGGGAGGCLIPLSLILGGGLIALTYFSEGFRNKVADFLYPPIRDVEAHVISMKDMNLDEPLPPKSISIKKIVGKYAYTYDPLSWKKEKKIFKVADLNGNRILDKNEKSLLEKRIENAVMNDRPKSVNPRKVKKMVLNSYSSESSKNKKDNLKESTKSKPKKTEKISYEPFLNRHAEFSKNAPENYIPVIKIKSRKICKKIKNKGDRVYIS